ncbi:hypothetical protein C815_00111 [Firmicutes bacterium M10-2]|nr:hypothetical protein C815_00111 [Firmicutes bacterium M10-2]
MKRSNLQILSKLIVFVKPMIGIMCIAILMGIAGFMAAILIPVLGAEGISLIMNGQTIHKILIAMILCAVFRGVLRYAEQACNHYIAFKLLAHIRDIIFGKLRELSYAKLEVKEKGNLISLITSDVELLEVFYAHTISPVCIALFVSLICVIWQTTMNPWLGLVAFAAYFVVGVVIPFVLSKRSSEAGRDFRQESGEQMAYVLESVRGLKELMWFNDAGKREKGILSKTRSLAKREKKIKQVMAFGLSCTNIAVIFFSVVMFVVANTLFQHGAVSRHEVLIAPILMISSFGPVIALSNLGTGLAQTLGAGNRLLNLLDEKAVIKEVDNGKNVAFDQIDVNQISFSYDSEEVLKDFSLEIPKNKILGIQGKSGCGKSTLLKLLMRMWDVNSGKINIDHANIKTINTHNLRLHESLVSQETMLFHDSIAANLRIAKQDATDEELVDACKKANIHEFIMTLSQGYNTEIAELGSSVSGGEKQRLGLARAFLHDGNFLLLDEPTSNLDSLNEGAILKAVDDHKEGKTIVLVSHRGSSLQFADELLKMEKI